MSSCHMKTAVNRAIERVHVFDLSGTFFSAPTTRCILNRLAAENLDITVFTKKRKESLRSFNGVEVRPYPVRWNGWVGDLRTTVRQMREFLQCWKAAIRPAPALAKPDLMVGINFTGVISAHQESKRNGVPFAYLSYELLFKNELTRAGQRREKQDEITASRQAGLIVIQDEWRARLLAEENGIALDRMTYLPVSPAGPCTLERTDYLRQRLPIPREKSIVLISGSFMTWTCAEEIIASVRSWPDDLVLVVNTYYKQSSADTAIKRLRSVAETRGNIHILNSPLENDEMEQMVRSADVGLVLYKATYQASLVGKNIEVMGLSSGKLSTYLKNGLPVVCGGNSVLPDFLRQYRFGEYVDPRDDLVAALRKVLTDRETYSRQSARFFQHRLDFDLFWPEVRRKTMALVE